MAFRWIEVLTTEDRALPVRRLAEEARCVAVVENGYLNAKGAPGEVSIRILVGEIDRQDLLDRLQETLEDAARWRIVLTETASVTPALGPNDEDETETRKRHKAAELTATREELFQTVARGAVTDRDYVVLVVLSTIVATIGLIDDNIAVVIGAMVIAPLLGPALALAFAASVGDRALLLRALRAAAVGLILPVIIAVALGLLIAQVVPVEMTTQQIATRTTVGLSAVALALASGAAAALSITGGVSAALVGVMVAAALLPPAATVGIALSVRAFDAAIGAAMLLGVTVICVTLAAIGVFLANGVRPRRWFERKGATQSATVTVIALAVALAGLVVAIVGGGRLLAGLAP